MPARTLAILASIFVLNLHSARADDPLSGTKPLIEAGDLASKMVDGIDRFLLRKIDESAAGRAKFWKWGAATKEDHSSNIELNRIRLRKMLGWRDLSWAARDFEVLSRNLEPPTIVEDETVRVVAVRWESQPDIHSEGLLLLPKGANRHIADVVAIPDSTQTPEMLCGLEPGVAPESRFPLRLARSGCRVLIPTLIDREAVTLIDRDVSQKRIPNREYLYRSSFELGRHIIGYELAKVLAAENCLRTQRGEGQEKLPFGIFGYGDGAMLAFYASAIIYDVDACGVSAYFGDRSKIWTEPVDRNVFGLLERFGDAEVAAMIAPRKLVVEVAKPPGVVVQPGTAAAPGAIASQDLAFVRKEAAKALGFVANLSPKEFLTVVSSGADGSGPFGSEPAVDAFLRALSAEIVPKAGVPLPAPTRPIPDRDARALRLRREIERKTQEVLENSHFVRDEYFKKLDTSSLAAYAKTIEPYREAFDKDVIGRFDDPLLPLNPRSRKVFDEPKYVGYEVMLDVFPDVFAYGILLVPKGIKPGEKRPVVVCQHGLEGRPSDVADPKVNNPAYNQFAVKLAERGLITFSPQNPYIFKDRFRTLQRKANPLGKTLFSIIVPQHRQIVAWLKTQDFVDPDRIAFYGLSYGGKSAMRIPALVTEYCLSICSADFNEWVWKNASNTDPHSYVWTGEYEIFEWDLGSTFNYAEMAALICPRPFMVERGHFDTVAPDEKVAHEYAKVRRLYNGKLKIGDRTEIEFFDGPHTIHGVGTFDFLHRHLRWPKPKPD